MRSNKAFSSEVDAGSRKENASIKNLRKREMSKSVPAIRGVKARAVVVPLKRPVKTALGAFSTGPLVLIDVETDQGVTGHAYIFA
jgi:hypothetical protein